MRQNTVIHVLLGVAVLAAIALLYVLLAAPDQSGLSPSQWVLLAAFALALALAACAPSALRRLRGVPPPLPLTPSDIRFCVLATLAGSALGMFGVYSGMWWLMVLGIMLPPLSFMVRSPRVQRDDPMS
jgi:hypothetical protein